MINLQQKDQEIVLICAFRYALGRSTYVSSEISHIIIGVWDDLSISYRELIQREIRDAIERDMAGMDCDVAEWEKVLRLHI